MALLVDLVLASALIPSMDAEAVAAATDEPTTTTIYLPRTVSSHMVLQAERPSLSGWTSADQYAVVQVKFKGSSGQIVTASSHPTTSSTSVPNATAWTVDLPPQNASLTPFDIVLTVAGGGGEGIRLVDCLMGDVFLCTVSVATRHTLPTIVVLSINSETLKVGVEKYPGELPRCRIAARTECTHPLALGSRR